MSLPGGRRQARRIALRCPTMAWRRSRVTLRPPTTAEEQLLKPGPNDCIVDVLGVRLGHAQHAAAHTGCSVVLVERGAIAGVDIGGAAPGTRENEMLNPTNMVMGVHAILLTGGSTFGLRAASGVQEFLVENEIGYVASTGVVVPIVPTACIEDSRIVAGALRADGGEGVPRHGRLALRAVAARDALLRHGRDAVRGGDERRLQPRADDEDRDDGAGRHRARHAALAHALRRRHGVRHVAARRGAERRQRRRLARGAPGLEDRARRARGERRPAITAPGSRALPDRCSTPRRPGW